MCRAGPAHIRDAGRGVRWWGRGIHSRPGEGVPRVGSCAGMSLPAPTPCALTTLSQHNLPPFPPHSSQPVTTLRVNQGAGVARPSGLASVLPGAGAGAAAGAGPGAGPAGAGAAGPEESEFFDPGIGARALKKLQRRPRATFDFVEGGEFQRAAEAFRWVFFGWGRVQVGRWGEEASGVSMSGMLGHVATSPPGRCRWGSAMQQHRRLQPASLAVPTSQQP